MGSATMSVRKDCAHSRGKFSHQPHPPIVTDRAKSGGHLLHSQRLGVYRRFLRLLCAGNVKAAMACAMRRGCGVASEISAG